MTAAKANSVLRGNEMVLGISYGASARAYPLNMISGPSREILNDTIDDLHVAITWCSLCYSSSVFNRKVDDGVLEFGVAGKLWNNNMVFYDTKTNSLWSQMKGEAMRGKLTGLKLERLPCDMMTWSKWKEMHPETSVAIFEPTSTLFNLKGALADDSLMIAMLDESESRAWSYATLRNHSIINDVWKERRYLVVRVDESGGARVFSSSFGKIDLQFYIHNGFLIDDQTESKWEIETGRAVAGPLSGAQLKRVPTITASKHKWLAFYPQTDFFVGDSK
jgi:hypothetical protein